MFTNNLIHAKNHKNALCFQLPAAGWMHVIESWVWSQHEFLRTLHWGNVTSWRRYYQINLLLTILISLEDLTFQIDVQIRFFLSFQHSIRLGSYIILKSFNNLWCLDIKVELHFIQLNSLNRSAPWHLN